MSISETLDDAETFETKRHSWEIPWDGLENTGDGWSIKPSQGNQTTESWLLNYGHKIDVTRLFFLLGQSKETEQIQDSKHFLFQHKKYGDHFYQLWSQQLWLLNSASLISSCGTNGFRACNTDSLNNDAQSYTKVRY